MECNILESLGDLCYGGPLTHENAFKRAVADGAKSPEFTQLVSWLSKQLQTMSEMDGCINDITSAEDSSSFLMEVSSFLKELGCPYRCLTEGNLSQRLSTIESRLLLLDFLIGELQAARMLASKNEGSKRVKVEVSESPTAADLKRILMTLGVSKPPPNITTDQLFTKIEAGVRSKLATCPPTLIGKPLFNGVLSEKQWHTLEATHTELQNDYRTRRQLLLTRLDVTIQSFRWSEKAKVHDGQIAAKWNVLRSHLDVNPNVKLADMLAARHSLLYLEKTSSATVRKNTQSDINKVTIGRVPDRGGRPNEQQAPPPEMPPWQKRQDGGGFGRGGRGGGRGGGQNDRGRGRGGGYQSGGGQDNQGQTQGGGSWGQSYQGNQGFIQQDQGLQYQQPQTVRAHQGGYQEQRQGRNFNQGNGGGQREYRRGGGGGNRGDRSNFAMFGQQSTGYDSMGSYGGGGGRY